MADKIYAIQALRALAAFLVLIEHVLRETIVQFDHDYDGLLFPWPIGIDLFFVISGFIMFYTNANRFGKNGAVAGFILRRVVRVVPLYYLVTTAIIGVAVIFPDTLGKTRFDVWHAISSYLFWPFERYDGRICPILSLGWTLNYEMFFYLLFAIALFFQGKLGLIALSGIIVSIVLLGQLFPLDSTAWIFWTSPIIVEFLMGAWLGAAFVGRKEPVKTRPLLLAGTIAFAILGAWVIWIQNFGELKISPWIARGLPSLLIVYASLFLLSREHGKILPKWIYALGDSSYSLYLSHRFPLRLMTLLWTNLIGVGLISGWIFMIAVTVICLIVGHLVYLFVEVPVLSQISQHLKKKGS